MARLTLHRKPLFWKFMLPLIVFVNGQPIGMMRGESVSIEIPEGTYDIAVRLMFQLWRLRFGIGGDRLVSVVEELPTSLEITDRERIWNILFDIDLVIWVASFFFTLPVPWNIVYHALSDGFFAVWIVRLVIIRNRYYKLNLLYGDR